MNKTKIEWTDYTWNPVVGCVHDCWYCYAKKIAIRFPKNFPNGFKPTFHLDRLKEPLSLKKPAKIFCCSISDLFAEWTKSEWREAVLDHIEGFEYNKPYLTFQLLTKQPQLIDKNYTFAGNTWVGVTVNNNEELWKVDEIKKVDAKVRFVSFEPLLDGITHLDLKDIEWVIVGKLTGSKKIKLQEWWVESIKKLCQQQGVPIFMKNNSKPEYKGELIQKFPKVI